MARYRKRPGAVAVIDDDIIDQLRGEAETAAAEAALPARLVAGWSLDAETGRPVCRWTLEER